MFLIPSLFHINLLFNTLLSVLPEMTPPPPPPNNGDLQKTSTGGKKQHFEEWGFPKSSSRKYLVVPMPLICQQLLHNANLVEIVLQFYAVALLWGNFFTLWAPVLISIWFSVFNPWSNIHSLWIRIKALITMYMEINSLGFKQLLTTAAVRNILRSVRRVCWYWVYVVSGLYASVSTKTRGRSTTDKASRKATQEAWSQCLSFQVWGLYCLFKKPSSSDPT